MSAIMISIRPEHNANILNGLKTIEVRTSCPKEWRDYLSGKTKEKPKPITVYDYCTKSNSRRDILCYHNNTNKYELFNKKQYEKEFCFDVNGKVCARFKLDRVDLVKICDPDILINGELCNQEKLEKETCLKIDELMEYIGYGDDYDGWGKDWDVGYLWHISNLKIYDKPKELDSFRKQNSCYCPGDFENLGCWECGCGMFEYGECDGRCSKIACPPQSWCYCEEI